jgi:hypothetical protein
LDTNQLARERLCLALLSMDKRFSDVRPRHPRGGPDGHRDIGATFRGSQTAFGAVGFLNQANDSDEHRKRSRRKFEDDLQAALSEHKIEVFVFFTNVNLTLADKSEMETSARSKGVTYCDIFDRERLRILLDSADGFAIRFQYLSIPLSEAEQATFFAKWGDDIERRVGPICVGILLLSLMRTSINWGCATSHAFSRSGLPDNLQSWASSHADLLRWRGGTSYREAARPTGAKIRP